MKSSQRVGYAVVGLGRIAERAVLPAFRNSRKAKLVAVVSGERFPAPGGKPTEQQVQAMVNDMQKLMQAHQMTMQEKMKYVLKADLNLDGDILRQKNNRVMDPMKSKGFTSAA